VSLSSGTGFNPRSSSPDNGSNPRSFTLSAYERQEQRNPPYVDQGQLERLERTLGEIQQNTDYGTPVHSPVSSRGSSPVDLPRTIVATQVDPRTIVATPVAQRTKEKPKEGQDGGKYSKNVYKKVGKKEVFRKR
jgi:hypothetical protein